jgi:hypothetical protein
VGDAGIETQTGIILEIAIIKEFLNQGIKFIIICGHVISSFLVGLSIVYAGSAYLSRS